MWYFSCLCCTNGSHLLNCSCQMAAGISGHCSEQKIFLCWNPCVILCRHTFVFTQAGRGDHLATRPHTSQGSLQLGLRHLSVPNPILFFPKQAATADLSTRARKLLYSFAHFLECMQFSATFAKFGLQQTNIPSFFRKWKEKLLLSVPTVGRVVTVAGFPLHVCPKLKQYFWNVDKTQFQNVFPRWCYATKKTKHVFSSCVPKSMAVGVPNFGGFLPTATADKNW